MWRRRSVKNGEERNEEIRESEERGTINKGGRR